MDCKLIEHSNIVDSKLSVNQNLNPTVQFYGKTQHYPPDIVNPAFTGMILWKISKDHNFNDYKLPKYSLVKCGITVDRLDAYVFTPILNNYSTSYLKITMGKKKKTKVQKSINDFTRISKHIILGRIVHTIHCHVQLPSNKK